MENLDSNNKNVSLSLIAEYGDSDSDDTETNSNQTGNDDSDAAELSEMVLKNNIINACAHGPLARPNPLEDIETTRHMIIDSSERDIVEYEVTEYRDVDSSDSDSSSDSSNSDVESVKDIVEEVSSGDEGDGKGKVEVPKVRGELDLDDLPPIEDLAISLPPQECTKIGTIASIVDRLVIVRAFPETPAVDLDSVLFLENGAKTLGTVFDVFGQVTEPHYCVRFNSSEHVRSRGVSAGADVFIAPRSQHTSYVFLTQLMKIKGSDASWLNDVEPPPHQIEYSDDEEERRANKARKEKQKPEESDGETSKKQAQARKPEPRRNHRPSESSSRFGSGPSRGRNPFAANSRRNNPNAYPMYNRPWNVDVRNSHNDLHFLPNSPPCPIFPPPFNPNTPPPSIGNAFQFGGNPRMQMNGPPFRQNVPIFGSMFCNSGPPTWGNGPHGPPPPPGT